MSIDALIDDILVREGGFVNHPADRGGPTHYGITQATLSRWRQQQVTVQDVQALTIEEARAIYRHDYIERPGFLRIPDERLRALLVDWGVHSGPQTAIRALQRVLGVRPDGVLGPVTLAALKTRPAADVYAVVLRWRGLWLADLLQRDPQQRAFAAGWLRRLMEFV